MGTTQTQQDPSKAAKNTHWRTNFQDERSSFLTDCEQGFGRMVIGSPNISEYVVFISFAVECEAYYVKQYSESLQQTLSIPFVMP